MNNTQTSTHLAILISGLFIFLISGNFLWGHLETNNAPGGTVTAIIIAVIISIITECVVRAMKENKINSFLERPIARYGTKANGTRLFVYLFVLSISFFAFLLAHPNGELKDYDFFIIAVATSSGYAIIPFCLFIFYAERIDSEMMGNIINHTMNEEFREAPLSVTQTDYDPEDPDNLGRS